MQSQPDSLFRFWAEMPVGSFRHPSARFVLERVPHAFPHTAPPNPFFGPLQSAPVVLLYLSPGLDAFDEKKADDPAYKSFFTFQWSGNAALPSEAEYAPWWQWWSRRVRQFGIDPLAVRERVAFLNISPYRSKSFHDWPMLAALPSSRAALDWAQDVLFPQAYDGGRIVVCMRSAKYWGLSPRMDGMPWGKGLYTLPFTQSGYLHHGEARERVGAAVRKKLRL